jgi:hypothetical protein
VRKGEELEHYHPETADAGSGGGNARPGSTSPLMPETV